MFLYARKYKWIVFALRYKAAVEHLEKGLLFLKREVKFEVHPWPGTNNIIQETTRNGLQVCLHEHLVPCYVLYKYQDFLCSNFVLF
jgi:hypothetical protein